MNFKYNPVSKKIFIDEKFCQESSMANDNWGRQGVTPFAVTAYIYHALNTLHKSFDEVIHAVTDGKWDSLYWGNSGIPITIWNKLFNGTHLLDEEWEKILFPLSYISEVHTAITTPTSKKTCYPMFFGHGRQVTELLVCSKEAYDKAILTKQSSKVTAYRYGLASGNPDILQLLREETVKTIIPEP